MNVCVRKPTIWGFRPGPTQTSLYSHRSRLEAGNFGFKKKRNCTIRVAKTKMLISFAVTAKLVCVFVFAYAYCWFSHEAAQNFVTSINSVCTSFCESYYVSVWFCQRYRVSYDILPFRLNLKLLGYS